MYRHELREDCSQSIEQLNETALSRMKFTTQIKDQPVDMDFTQINSQATASLLEVFH